MRELDYLNDAKFWEILSFLTKKDGSYPLRELAQEFGIGQAEIRSYASLLKNLGLSIEFNESKLEIRGLKSVVLELSLLDWVAFQAHFPFLSEQSKAPYHKILRNFLVKKEAELKEHDFFDAYNVFYKSLESYQKNIVSVIEEALLMGQTLRIKSKLADTNFHCFPYRLSYIQNSLSLIAEEKKDKSLLCLSLEQIESAVSSDEKYEPSHSQAEIFSFMDSFRNFAESEERLVLKIYKPNIEVNLDSDYHYFRNPSLIRSSRGDFIWSAYVEKGEKIHEWLEELWKVCQFDILSPDDLSDSFDEYLYSKMSLLKKAV